MDSNKFQSVDLRKYICPLPGIKVLVVDGNLTFLQTASKMLQKLGYEVVTASLASEALSIVEEMKNDLNLALLEVHLPDMEIDVFTEKLREISELPYILMTADDNLFKKLHELCLGSKLYLKKPVKIPDLSSLWKYVIWKREDENLATREQKRKEENLKIGGEQSESFVLKRKRLSWTDNSRKKVLGTVGLAESTVPPTQRLQLTNAPEFTEEDFFSQIFDQSFEEVNPIQQQDNIYSSDLDAYSSDLDIYSSDLDLASQDVSQTDNDEVHKPQLPNRQIYLCNCMYLHSQRTPLTASLFSSDQKSIFGQNPLHVTWEPQAFAYCSSTSGEFFNKGNGEVSAQVEDTTDGKVFMEDACDYSVDDLTEQNEMDFSTLLVNDMCQKFPPLLPVPLLPSDEKKHGNFGAEARQIDEVFYPPSGTQKFSDKDLKIWLSQWITK